MSRDQKGMAMAAAGMVFFIVVQIGVIVWAGGPQPAAPIAEAMNVPAK
jgi:hypothetical protein